jgi:hypothetical protein
MHEMREEFSTIGMNVVIEVAHRYGEKNNNSKNLPYIFL